MYRGTRTANLMICTLQNPFSLVIPYQVTKGNNAYSRLQHLLHICTLTSKAVVFTKDTAYLIQNQNRQNIDLLRKGNGPTLVFVPPPLGFRKNCRPFVSHGRRATPTANPRPRKGSLLAFFTHLAAAHSTHESSYDKNGYLPCG